jgi:DNA-binding NarL/FixJ family response regulator
MESIRVIIADDHNVVRAGFRNWLEAEPDIVVVAEARNGEEAIRLVKELAPDVLLQDIQMPGMDGLDVIRALSGEATSTRILVITGFDTKSARVALESGACGYLTKEEKREIIVEAVRWAARGEKGVWMSPSVAEELAQRENAVARAELTRAEINLLRLIEHSNADIARLLLISESTVKNHFNNIYNKLGLHSRREVTKWARSHGLLDAE